MSEPIANPTRLSRLSDAEAPDGVVRMFRSARELPDEDLPTLMWRLRASQRLRATRPRLILRVVLVVGAVFCMGGVVGAYWGTRRPTTVAPPAATPTAPPPRPQKARRALRPPETRPEPVPEPALAPTKALPDEPKAAPPPTRHRTATPVAMLSEPALPPEPSVAPATAPSPTAPSPIAVEQALVGQAMKALRDAHEAQTALALLSEHARRFPNGALLSEANLLRVEALLVLGRKDEALSVLDRAPLAMAPNRDEQVVLRGELRSASGRWREAREDFDEALRGHADTLAARAKARSIQERALWGRAAARSRLGDEDGGRADLALYLRLFPSGRFAGPAANLLKASP